MLPLQSQFTPQLLSLNLDVSDSLIESVAEELSAKASNDPNKCFGYFPGMNSNADIDADLPISQQFAQKISLLSVDSKNLKFNFLRLSLINQPSVSPFHLDSDSATALTGDVATIDNRLVWRLLINLSHEKSRTITYLNIDPSSVKLKKGNGYIAYPTKSIDTDLIKEVAISARTSNSVHAVMFCASRVLHAGKDIDGGHFVAGYGVDQSQTMS